MRLWNFSRTGRVIGADVITGDRPLMRKLLGVGLVCLAVALARGQEAEKPPAGAMEAEPFWDDWTRKKFAAAAEMILAQDPIVASAMRLVGHEEFVWGVTIDDHAPELNRKWLNDIRDGQPLPRIAGRLRNEIPQEDWAIYMAYSEALVNAFYTPLEAFKRSAEGNRHVTFSHLWVTPDKYRGQVIPLKGRMVRLRKLDAPIPAKNQWVKELYEGWVFGETKNAHPFCIIFPILPAGLKEAEDMRQDVTFYGYFLAKFKYRAAEADKVAPLLIGPTVVLENKPARSDREVTPFPLMVLGVAMGFLAFLTVVFFVINFWLRRGDEKIRTKLTDIQSKNAGSMFENEGSSPPPAAPPPYLSDGERRHDPELN